MKGRLFTSKSTFSKGGAKIDYRCIYICISILAPPFLKVDKRWIKGG